MEKDELIKKMNALETNVALSTTHFLIAADETKALEVRKLHAEEYLGQIDTLIGTNVYPSEIAELYLEGKYYLHELVENDFQE